MRSEFEDAVRVCALTERPDLVELVAGWHWKEWGSDEGDETRVDWVSGMVVRNAARNLGVGRVLLGTAEERCHGLGFRRIWLHTGEAKRFYERCGWALVRAKQALHDDAVLCRALGSG